MAIEIVKLEEGAHGTAGEALTKGDAVCKNATDGLVYKANAKTGYAATRFPALGFADKTVAAGAEVGIIRAGSLIGFSGLTIGAAVYLSETHGGISSTAPGDAGDLVQALGMAVAADEIVIDVESGYAVVGN